MEKPIEAIEYKGFEIRIYPDIDPESPREWDNMGKMVCWHRRYNLGDEQPKYDPLDYMVDVLNHEQQLANDYENIPEDKIEKMFNKIAISLPLYLYDHSGITMNTTGFSCPWDSGQVGFIYVLKKDVLKEWNKKKMSKQLYEKAVKVLKQEVETYDQYLRGDVYGFQIIEPYTDNNLDSCWGFYGLDYCIQEAKDVADYWAKERDSGAWEKQPTGMED